MIINFTNHPSMNWCANQIQAAKKYGEIVDIPFPDIPADCDESCIQATAEELTNRILQMKPEAVLCQGEHTLTFSVAKMLISKEIIVLAACSSRNSTDFITATGATSRHSVYKFERFRRYI